MRAQSMATYSGKGQPMRGARVARLAVYGVAIGRLGEPGSKAAIAEAEERLDLLPITANPSVPRAGRSVRAWGRALADYWREQHPRRA